MTPATLLLTPLLTLVLLLIIAQVARMARGWADSRVGERAGEEQRERISLEDDKERLLLSLRDLEFEHAMGRLEDSDYAKMKARLEGDAIAIIERLEGML